MYQNLSVIELCNLIIEYFSNTNAAGEYDGDSPILKHSLCNDLFIEYATRIKNEKNKEQFRRNDTKTDTKE